MNVERILQEIKDRMLAAEEQSDHCVVESGRAYYDGRFSALRNLKAWIEDHSGERE